MNTIIKGMEEYLRIMGPIVDQTAQARAAQGIMTEPQKKAIDKYHQTEAQSASQLKKPGLTPQERYDIDKDRVWALHDAKEAIFPDPATLAPQQKATPAPTAPAAPTAASEWPKVEKRFDSLVYTYEDHSTSTVYENRTRVDRDPKGEVTRLGGPDGQLLPVTKSVDPATDVVTFTNAEGFVVTDHLTGWSSVGKNLATEVYGQYRLDNGHTRTVYSDKVSVETDASGVVTDMSSPDGKKHFKFKTEKNEVLGTTTYTAGEEGFTVATRPGAAPEIRWYLGGEQRHPMPKLDTIIYPHVREKAPEKTPEKRPTKPAAPTHHHRKRADAEEWKRDSDGHWTNDGVPTIGEKYAQKDVPHPGESQDLSARGVRVSPQEAMSVLGALERDLDRMLEKYNGAPAVQVSTLDRMPTAPRRDTSQSITL
jgi:hypothetical protein